MNSLPPFPSPIAIAYCRVSTSEQATHGWSIGQQETSLQRVAQEKGLRLLATLSDPGRSGSGLKRPGLLACLELIAQGGVGVLLVTRLDRLSRTLKHILALRNWIHRHGTDLLVVEGSTHLRAAEAESGTSHDTLMVNLAAILAEHEITTLKDRIFPNLRKAALAGNRGGRVPLGYRREDTGRITVEPHDAALLMRCVSSVLAGVGVSSLSRTLVSEGVRDVRGRHLSFDRIRGALTNSYVTGELIYHLPLSVAGENPVVRIPDHHPRLVDPVTFAQLKLRLGGPKHGEETASQRRIRQRQGQRLSVATDLLQAMRPVSRPAHGALPPEIARCGHCGGSMYASLQTVGSRGQRTQVASYICRFHKDRGMAFCPQPPAATIDIDDQVFARLQRHWGQTVPSSPPQSAPSSQAADLLARGQAQVDRLTAAVASLGSGTPSVLRHRLEHSQAELARLTMMAQTATGSELRLRGPIDNFRRHPQAVWNQMDAASRRHALRHVLRLVHIHKKMVTSIEFTDAVPASETAGTPAATPEGTT